MANVTAKWNGVKVFSATLVKDREMLGETVTQWVTKNKDKLAVVETVVTQSSDQAFHCITISVFYASK